MSNGFTPMTFVAESWMLEKDAAKRARMAERGVREKNFGFAPYFGRAGVEEQLPVSWAIDGVIQDYSVNVLFGEAETYKTFFAIDWAWTLSDPNVEEWHGRAKSRNFRPLYVFTEGRAGLQKRMHAWENNFKRRTLENGVVWLFEGMDLMQFESRDRYGKQIVHVEGDTSDADRLEQLYEKVDANMLIVDTLSATMRGDTNSNADAQRYMDTLTKFAERGPVLVTHHTQKGDKKEYRGATTIRNSSDVMLLTSPTGSGTRVQLEHAKNKDNQKQVLGIFDKNLDPDSDSMSLEKVLATQEDLTGLPLRTLNVLQEKGPLTAKQVADTLDKSAKHANNLLNVLKADGLARRQEDNNELWEATLEVIE